jgi:hypothetical protein
MLCTRSNLTYDLIILTFLLFEIGLADKKKKSWFNVTRNNFILFYNITRNSLENAPKSL